MAARPGVVRRLGLTGLRVKTILVEGSEVVALIEVTQTSAARAKRTMPVAEDWRLNDRSMVIDVHPYFYDVPAMNVHTALRSRLASAITPSGASTSNWPSRLG